MAEHHTGHDPSAQIDWATPFNTWRDAAEVCVREHLGDQLDPDDELVIDLVTAGRGKILIDFTTIRCDVVVDDGYTTVDEGLWRRRVAEATDRLERHIELSEHLARQAGAR